ncbi:hypothetical protein I302_108237 [Kwoniella bestiolae CBS 10118]|uniref:Uncharacterized protein n=1 Tax=Kwoniella bestiolae CBS 10118 TaxID=1296100 RepID=A0A1B9FWA7_9TREE|nr:hypothetical protein I302_07398 [Kwoniella bestiolae CBS 10118]OCF23048.1 hypothetical protein I302_07398 [Kwoniella bestiolae CBS 10118]
MVSLNLFRRRQVKSSVLDVPLEKYDKETGLPATIKIGDEDYKPFVSLQETRDHLTFLSALSALRHSLPSSDTDDTPFKELCQQSAMAYAYWVQHVLKERGAGKALSSGELPCLEVLMAWHSHLLNPTIYQEDIGGEYSTLQGMNFPLSTIATAIREKTLPPFQPTTPEHVQSPKQTKWSAEDVGMAIGRQAKFIGHMKRIGWLDEKYWENGVRELQFSIVLYHAWLDLMQSTECKYFLVPRLDIDLAWHTHQLHHGRYKADTTRLLGKLLNHNDAAGDEKLGNGMEVTRKLWKKRFGWEYQ